MDLMSSLLLTVAPPAPPAVAPDETDIPACCAYTTATVSTHALASVSLQRYFTRSVVVASNVTSLVRTVLRSPEATKQFAADHARHQSQRGFGQTSAVDHTESRLELV